VAPPAGVKRYDAKTFLETTSIGAAGFSHDGTKVLTTMDSSGVFNLYSIPIAGGPPVRLTTSTESQKPVSYFPADDRFLYLEDKGGNELDHLYVVEVGGQPKDLTPGDKLKADFLEFSADDQFFYVMTNERDPKAFDVYRYAAKDYKRERVWQNPGGFFPDAVSRDGRWIALSKPRTNADSDVYLIDLKAKAAKPKHITPHKGDVDHAVYTFSPDSRKLWYGTDGHGEFRQAWAYDVGSGKHQAGVAASWDVVRVDFSEKGRFSLSVTNEDGKNVLHVVDAKTAKELPLPSPPEGTIGRVFFSRSETNLGIVMATDRTPADVYVIEDLGKGAIRQLTKSLGPAIDPADLVEAEVVRYPSFDEMKIPALLYKPRDASPQHKVPAVVYVHGGPGGQTKRTYAADVQFLTNHGYAVLAVNNRGSSGYGKTFYHLDDKKHGDVDLKDCVFGRKYLASLDWVDGTRVGIMGGSYGGYMTVAALAFAPDAFDLGIDVFGVTNWVRTLESIPPWWSSERDALYAELGDPNKDKERLRSISPLFHADKIKKPLLVVQGANDPRVLKVESDEIVAAAKKNGAPVEYLVFPDEGHGFTKKKNRIAALEAYLSFLEKHLR
jgi:dipeptidyl aminopeptidase/acylaminoacyl peptidase